jgi:hypothetical protein
MRVVSGFSLTKDFELKYLSLIFVLCFSPFVHATCDLTGPEVRSMVEAEIQSKTSGDLTKAFWINAFKSGVYSVFSVQFKTVDAVTKVESVTTHMVTVSCSPLGVATVDSDMAWSVPLDSLHLLN